MLPHIAYQPDILSGRSVGQAHLKSNLGVGFALNMLSALIRSEYSYSAMQQVATTDTLEIRSSRSSRTKVKSPQIS